MPRFLVPLPEQPEIHHPTQVVLAGLMAGFDLPEPVMLAPSANQKPLQTLALALDSAGCRTQSYYLPLEHILSGEALPLPLVVAIPSHVDGTPDYPVLIWNQVGPLFQVLNPFEGRLWLTQIGLQTHLAQVTETISEAEAQRTLESDAFTAAMRERLTRVLVMQSTAQSWLEMTQTDWRTRARLDAALRRVTHLINDNAIEAGNQANQALDYWMREAPDKPDSLLHESDWTFYPDTKRQQVVFRGVRALHVMPSADAPSIPSDDAPPPPVKTTFSRLWQAAIADGRANPVFIGIALVVATIVLFFEAILLRGLIDLTTVLQTPDERLTALLFVGLSALLLLGLKWGIRDQMARIGRRLDIRLRQTAYRLLPKLPERFFRQIALGDMAERFYHIKSSHRLPERSEKLISNSFEIVLMLIAFFIIDATIGSLALVRVLIFVVGLRIFHDNMLRGQRILREQLGNLNAHFLDTLMARMAIWWHRAERSVHQRYEALLVTIADRRLMLNKHLLIALMLNYSLGAFTLFVIIITYANNQLNLANLVLIVYWLYRTEELSARMVQDVYDYATDITKTRQFVDALNTPGEAHLWPTTSDTPESNVESDNDATAIAIRLDAATVQESNHTLLQPTTLAIDAGEHIAIVGQSGAGKTTLAGILLGRYPVMQGMVWIDEQRLTYERLQRLRQQIAWVDPTVHLWNQSLLDNLRYGVLFPDDDRLWQAIDMAELRPVIDDLPDGLQTIIGDNGRLLASGEAQRVRFARALQQPAARLVILDEAFRGVDSAQAQRLLQRARDHWADATLLHITHDVEQTQNFERVLVIRDGRIIEDDHPQALLQNDDSYYQILLNQQRQVGIQHQNWRHWQLRDGQLHESNAVNGGGA